MARFDTTNWTVVFRARDGHTTEARKAVAALCETCWYPVYAFIRRRGYSAADAEDLTQVYFTRFLEKDYVTDVRPEGAELDGAQGSERHSRLGTRRPPRGGGWRPNQPVEPREVVMRRPLRTLLARCRLVRAGLAIVSPLVALGCATIAHGPHQGIRITSEPPGARVLVKGEDTGITPARVFVKRKDSTVVLRLEKAGYKPVEITLKRATSRWVAGDIAWGATLFAIGAPVMGPGQAAIQGVVYLAITLGVDALTGAVYKLVPGEVHVTLEVLAREP